MTLKERKKVKFKDIATFKYGSMPKKDKILTSGKYPIYSGYRYTGHYSEYNTKENTLIVIARGVGGTGDVKLTKEKCFLTNLSISIDVTSSEINKKFLYYYFLLNNLRYLDTGSAQAQITISDLEKLDIPLYPLDVQEKIANMLSKLDEKIELNEKINENLELQASVVYSNLDFSKTEAKKLPLDYFCNIFTGKKNANQQDKKGLFKFFTCGPEPLKINSFIYDGSAVIIAGNGAYTGRTTFYEGKFDLYQRTYGCTLKENMPENHIYLLYVIIKNELSKKIMGGTSGSAIPYIVMNDLAKFEINYQKDIFDNVSETLKPIIRMILKNKAENERLIQLRDTLLPELINGNIDI